jgi:hypothetical protein
MVKSMRTSSLSPIARSLIAAALGTLLFCLVTKSWCDNVRRCKSEVAAQSLTLWAWDAPEDLSFLKNEPTTVAYYAGTITLKPREVLFCPRSKPIKAPAGLDLYPVFRIENSSQMAPPDSEAKEIVEIVSAVMNVKDNRGHFVHDVQIDYDATTSDRAFYVHLLKALRQNLPTKTHIAITALASWAMHDRWLPPGIADEGIVMLFSMGSENEILKSTGKKRWSVGDGIDTSVGISVNEPLTNALLSRQNVIQSARRLYIFNSIPWTRDRYLSTKRLLTNNIRISSLNNE